jgi:Zn-dependent protease
MGMISLLFSNTKLFIVLSVFLLYSIIAHEVAHGVVALLLGDDTAKRSGRLSLNPVSHIDPMGTLMLFIAGFGWARPVPVDFFRLRNTRLGLVLVSLAGCLTNILIATAALSLLRFEFISSNQNYVILCTFVARINIILGSFNLIPIPPLDGSKILMGVLPEDLRNNFARLEPYGFFILVILLFTGLLNPVINFMYNLVYSLILLTF